MKTAKPIDPKTFGERTIFGTQEAAIYAGVKPRTFLHHIHSQGRIKPNQVNPRLFVFSREQLDDYIANGNRTDMVFDQQFFTFEDAAAFLKIDTRELRRMVEAGQLEPVDGVAIGGQFIYTKTQLESLGGYQ